MCNSPGCKGAAIFNTLKPCRVCELLDKDNGEKLCTYCETCKAYICESDYNNWDRRTVAATLEWGHKTIKTIHGIWNHIKTTWE